MPDAREGPHRPLLEAIAFAARAHQGQLRKDGQTPYVSHVFRVALILRHVFGIDDTNAIVTAVLHDTIEDTTTDFDDIEKQFGRDVASWVGVLSKDKRLPEPERERAYEHNLVHAPWQVKVCKLADVYDNLMDLTHMPAGKRQKSRQNAHRYLAALQKDVPPQASRPWEIVAQLLAETEKNAIV